MTNYEGNILLPRVKRIPSKFEARLLMKKVCLVDKRARMNTFNGEER
jgi:hypothetical protein